MFEWTNTCILKLYACIYIYVELLNAHTEKDNHEETMRNHEEPSGNTSEFGFRIQIGIIIGYIFLEKNPLQRFYCSSLTNSQKLICNNL